MPSAETSHLRALRHDNDLLPSITAQCENLLSCLPREYHVSYDIQGFGDQGTDILIRLTAGGSRRPGEHAPAASYNYMGLQVKSHSQGITPERLEQSIWLQEVAWKTPWEARRDGGTLTDPQPWDLEHRTRVVEA